jgi:hypothetical protein
MAEVFESIRTGILAIVKIPFVLVEMSSEKALSID